ncbi:Hsp70/Hsp90 co-chaperone cns1 [Escovopsis weberi]|uniref:Hsp70/Hsp90 co-chaperone cns1 n=1 Tax=Escovopsis weberi TaxID=150374 RepID=A0A0M8MZY3_ESCWE|nr:Hsp70/Hsp90 co-chaperone cns1 [Escovopsis weberi]
MDDAEIERQIDAHIDKLAAQYEASSLSNAQSSAASPPDDDGPRPELPPGMVVARSQTADEILADLNKSPLFMTDLEDNDDVAALQALAYEGTPLENAEGFKERGNECFRMRGYRDANEFYSKGILILAAEERKRQQQQQQAAAGSATAVKDTADGNEGQEKQQEGVEGEGENEKEKEKEKEDEVQQERQVLEAMYLNRAACHLELKNYRSCWTDCGAAIRLNAGNVKAYYRSARALLAVDRIAEADDACARGLALDEGNAALRAVADDIVSRARFLDEKRRKERESQARRERRVALLAAALRARGIATRETAQPPEMEDARVRLAPDEDDPASELVVPTMLLYPLRMESDFIKAFGETHTLEQHLAYVLPPPWDAEQRYVPAGVVCYVETGDGGGLLKMGKRVSLLKVLSGGKVVLVDQVMRIFVLPADEADAWAKQFKEKRAAEKSKR